MQQTQTDLLYQYLIHMKITNVAIDKIQPYEFNNKDHRRNLDDIVKSIKDYWFRVPILLDQKHVIIAWHGRREAAKKIGMDTIPCIIHTDLTDEQVKELRALDNLIGDLADYNAQNMMIDFWASQNKRLIDIIKSQVKTFKLNDDNTKEMMEDNVPCIPRNIVIKHGDIVTLGSHRLMCGDSTLPADVQKLMRGNKADCVRTDPPYNVNYKWRWEKTSKQDIINDNVWSDVFKQFLSDVFRCMMAEIKKWAWVYVFHTHKEQVTFQEALEEQGFTINQQIIRNKQNMSMWHWDYRSKHELCFYVWVTWAKQIFYWDRANSTVRDPLKGKTDEEILRMIKKAKEAEARWYTTIRSVSRENVNNYDHTTQKPVMLCQIPLANSTKVDDIVLDLFHGSGTLLITCEKIWRTAYAMELDPIYVETAVERRVQYTGITDVDINGEVKEWQEWKQTNRLSL